VNKHAFFQGYGEGLSKMAFYEVPEIPSNADAKLQKLLSLPVEDMPVGQKGWKPYGVHSASFKGGKIQSLVRKLKNATKPFKR
jgi:hypothetical protein